MQTKYADSCWGFEKLEVWRQGMQVVKEAYLITDRFPESERYGLTSQIRRAAVSIPTNIAEGWGRGQGAANVNFARVARGSAYELRTLLLLAGELHFCESVSTVLDSLENFRKLLQGYIKSMEAKSASRD